MSYMDASKTELIVAAHLGEATVNVMMNWQLAISFVIVCETNLFLVFSSKMFEKESSYQGRR